MTDSNEVAKTLLEDTKEGKLQPVKRSYLLGALTKEQRARKFPDDEWDDEED